MGDTLRSVLLAPIPYLNEREPLFNVMQFPESGFKGTVVDYRNIPKVLVDPSSCGGFGRCAIRCHGFSAGRGDASGTDPGGTYAICRGASCGVGANLRRGRARPLDRFRQQVQSDGIRQARSRKVRRGDEGIPKGYILAQQSDDFLGSFTNSRLRARASCSIPILTKGSSPFRRRRCWLPATVSPPAFRGRADGSYMTTSKVFTPRYRFFRLEGRAWVEMRGFWDVEGDLHGRSVRKLYDRRYGDRPGFHAGLLCLFSETSQTQLYARSGTLASSGEIPRSDRFRICDCHRWQAGGGKIRCSGIPGRKSETRSNLVGILIIRRPGVRNS